ncbi:UNVERIFIED_CONTAM: hypothetical protein FKN15_059708 [Acipenser sinensis]
MALENMENVEVFNSEGKGRGLRATKELWAGDVLFAEPSYSAVVFDRWVPFILISYCQIWAHGGLECWAAVWKVVGLSSSVV